MSIKSILNTIKGIGGQAGKEAINVAEVALGAGTTTAKVGETVASKMFKPITGKPESLIQHIIPYKLKTGAAFGIVGAMALYGVGGEAEGTRNRNKMGTISSGEMANTIGISRSPNLGATVDRMAHANPKSKFVQDTLGANTYGAEGDIVFALHNLRNG